MHGAELQQELEEVTMELDTANRDKLIHDDELIIPSITENNHKKCFNLKQILLKPIKFVFSPVWIQTFILTFAAEWGDRSQISTVALAGSYDYLWVIVGGLCGHAICSIAAVLGGRMVILIAKRFVSFLLFIILF
jgi:putative Ca2+/H+ antiporter (TMEM165/GDT1 family)